MRVVAGAAAYPPTAVAQLARATEEWEVWFRVEKQSADVDSHRMEVFTGQLVFCYTSFLVTVPAHLFDGVVTRSEFSGPEVGSGSFMGFMAISTQPASSGLAGIFRRGDPKIVFGIGHHRFVNVTVGA